MIKRISKRDHSAIIIDECLGLHSRDDRMVPPDGYLSQAENVVYGRSVGVSPAPVLPSKTRMVGIREDFNAYVTLSNACNDRFYIYEKSTGDRIIYIDGSGNIRDHTSGVTILTVSAGSKFSGLTLNDRFYFTIGEGTGNSGEFIYLYDPSLSSTARKIAGTKPGAGLAAAVSGTNGVIEPGQHVYAVSFITNTGHITPPGSHVILTSPSGTRKKTSLTGIPTGASYVTKRRIWMSQVVRQYDGNITAVPLFFVGDVNDNSTTTATVDAYDSQLISSADPYLDTLEEVPSGAWLNIFDGRLVSCGESAAPNGIRVSNRNEPESFNSVNGFRDIDKFNGGPIRTTRSLKGNLYCWKSNRTYVVFPISEFPSEWKWDIVDTSIGAETRGVSEINNNSNPVFDSLLVAHVSGLYIFNGSYVDQNKPLSHNIEFIWRFMMEEDGNAGVVRAVAVDPSNFRVYVLIVGGDFTRIMFMDFLNGLTFNTVKWSVWNLDHFSAGFLISDIHCRKSILYSAWKNTTSIKSLTVTNISNINGSDAGQASDSSAKIAFAFADSELRLMQCNGIKAWMGITTNNFSWVVNGRSGGAEAGGAAVNLTLQDSNKAYENKFNTKGQIVEAVISKNGSGNLYLSDFIIFISPLYQEIPQ